jgi:hypothetical protein
LGYTAEGLDEEVDLNRAATIRWQLLLAWLCDKRDRVLDSDSKPQKQYQGKYRSAGSELKLGGLPSGSRGGSLALRDARSRLGKFTGVAYARFRATSAVASELCSPSYRSSRCRFRMWKCYRE